MSSGIGHTEKVIVVEQQTWVTLLGFAGFGLALMGYLASMKRELKADNAALRAELKTDNAALRAELKADNAAFRAELKVDNTELKTEMRLGFSDLKADLGRIDARLAAVENRTYDISARLPPAPAARSPHAS